MVESRRKLPPGIPPEVLLLLKKQVSFYPELAKLCKSVTAGVMLSQAIYWTTIEEVQERDCWFYKSWKDWQKETNLSRREQDAAKVILRKNGFIDTDIRRAPNGDRILYFRVNFEAIFHGLAAARNGATRCTAACTDGGSGLPENVQPMAAPNGASGCTERGNVLRKQEITAENTQEITGEGSPLRLSPTALAIQHDRKMEARKLFFKILGSLQIDSARGIDAEKMRIVHIAAAESGIGRTAAKAALREHPDWKLWPYLEHIDSQAEIAFPPDPVPPKPQEIRALPEGMDVGFGIQLWAGVRDWLEKHSPQHSFETWVKPLRAIGILGGALYVRIPTPEFHHIEEKFDFNDVKIGRLHELIFLTSEELNAYDFEKRKQA